MATTSIADKLAKLEKKIAKREKAIADETKELDKDRAEYNKLYIMFLSDKYKLSGKDLFSAIEREHEQLEKLREEAAAYAQQEEDVLSYAMFPKVSVDFFEKRRAAQLGVNPALLDKENKTYPI